MELVCVYIEIHLCEINLLHFTVLTIPNVLYRSKRSMLSDVLNSSLFPNAASSFFRKHVCECVSVCVFILNNLKMYNNYIHGNTTEQN